jgi:hypothetical protein
MSEATNKPIMAKVIFNLKSDEEELKYSKYDEELITLNDLDDRIDDSDRINAYWGLVQAFQSGSNNGKTKKYKNVNGLLKIESSKWKNPNIKQSKENRQNPENWDESVKLFMPPEIILHKVDRLKENQRLDKCEKDDIIFMFNYKVYVVKNGQCVEFGDINNPKIKIY